MAERLTSRVTIQKKNPFPFHLAIAGWLVTGPLAAQTFTTLYSFTGGSDGANPVAGLVLFSNTLYGTTSVGANLGAGTVFALNTDGTGLVNLHSFTDGSDGGFPEAGLVLSSNTLYGTASAGGDFGAGAVFGLGTDGMGFATLYSFIGGNDGATPYGALLLSGGILYGTAATGGDPNNGTLFRLDTDGSNFTTLHVFDATMGPFPPTNSDGAAPQAGLLLLNGFLYGTAQSGGGKGLGTLFKINTDGTVLSVLHSFAGSDGANPTATLVSTGLTLYGTTSKGGGLGRGTVFKIGMDGGGFATLYHFTGGADGAGPLAGLMLANNTLYGTTSAGGSSGNGTVFCLNTDGSGFTILHSFTATSGVLFTNSDGASPQDSLISSSNTLYGTTSSGGAWGKGTVFSVFILPRLEIVGSGAQVILTWPSSVIGFALQSTTNLNSPAWTNVSTAPVVVNGQNTVTNPISGIQQFFRLSQ
jgi:uncharacterized repeat protein (TIGR03803 family)